MKRDKLGVLTWRLLRQRQRSDLYDNYRDNYRASAESAAGSGVVTLLGDILDGDLLTVEVTGSRVVYEFDSAGDGVAGVNVAVDVEGLPLAGAAAALQSAIETAQDGYLTVDRAGTVLTLNPAAGLSWVELSTTAPERIGIVV